MITDSDNAVYLALLANSFAPAESLQHSLKQAASDFDFYKKSDETEFQSKWYHFVIKWQAFEICIPVHIPL